MHARTQHFLQFHICIREDSDQPLHPCSLIRIFTGHIIIIIIISKSGALWLSGRASDYGAKGVWGFLKNMPPCCALNKQAVYFPKVLVIPRKRWFRPDMTARLLTEAFNHNTNKNTLPGFVYIQELSHDNVAHM